MGGVGRCANLGGGGDGGWGVVPTLGGREGEWGRCANLGGGGRGHQHFILLKFINWTKFRFPHIH